MKPLFIVIEGIDGAGKTTQAERLAQYFQAVGQGAVLSPEPTAGPIGQLIRQAMQTPVFSYGDRRCFEAQMGYLFAADRHYHLYDAQDGVFSHLERGNHVIATRYYFSSLAYNCHTEGDWEFVRGLNQAFPLPDVLIYLDLPVSVALQRIGDRPQQTPTECYEQQETLTQVYGNYQRILAHYPGSHWILDGQNPIEALQLQIQEAVQTFQPPS